MAHKILIVEDDPLQIKLAYKMLEKEEGYQILKARDAAEARKYLDQKDIEIVLCDIGLPGESGLDLTKYIAETYDNTIVIMLSASEDLETSQIAIENGAFGYLVKPVKASQLRISVLNALKNQTYQKVIQEQQSVIEEQKEELAGVTFKLAEKEKQFNSIFENIHEGFYRTTMDGRLVMANPYVVKLLGFESFNQIAGINISQFYQNPDDRKKMLEKLEKDGSISAYEIKVKREDGSKGTLLVNSYLIKDHDGDFFGMEGTIVDITELKRLEAELSHAQKLESIGQLAAGIAHEINTPVQYIGDNTEFVKDAFEDLNQLVDQFKVLLESARKGMIDERLIRKIDETIENTDIEFLAKEVPAAITQSLEGVERVSKIVRSMKEFSHPGSEEKTMTDINHAIENTVTVAKNEWKYVADLVLEFDETLPKIPCNPGEINQVLLNMIINASHAIADVLGDHPEGKGKITVQTKNEKDHIDIVINDTGSGIPEKMQNKIFDPFFTTKEVGKGTGQGLAISHSVIVDKHKGKIKLASQKGKGTAFTITLPKENQS